MIPLEAEVEDTVVEVVVLVVVVVAIIVVLVIVVLLVAVVGLARVGRRIEERAVVIGVVLKVTSAALWVTKDGFPRF